MIKTMIFFDVDGTLLNNKTHAIPISTMQALKLLKEKGYSLGIATGRSPSSLEHIGVMDIIHWDIFICNNGQTILDANKQLVAEHFFNSTTVKQCIEVAKNIDIPLALKMESRLLTKTPTIYVKEACTFFNNEIPPVGIYNNQPVQAMIAYAPIGYDYSAFKQIEGVNVLPGVSTYCDLTIKGISKASAITEVLPLFGANAYIAFGDSQNDYEMFIHAKQSIAMGQGDAKIKSIADFITKSVDKDGIFYACKSLQYI